MAVIGGLREVCRLLGAANLSAGELASQVAEAVDDQGAGLPLLFRPADAAFDAGQIVRRWKADEVAHVELVPSGELTLEALAEFGAWQDAPSLHGPRQATCFVAQPEAARDCTLIADVSAAGVTCIRIRPDAR